MKTEHYGTFTWSFEPRIIHSHVWRNLLLVVTQFPPLRHENNKLGSFSLEFIFLSVLEWTIRGSPS